MELAKTNATTRRLVPSFSQWFLGSFSKKMSFNMNDIKKEVTKAYNQKLRVETTNATGGFLAYR
jgi:hypothetical protein